VSQSAEQRRAAVETVIHESGLPRALIARLAGVDESTVWAWLRPRGGGAARAPKPESVAKLAAGLRDYGERLAALADRLPM
jgi:transposase-like protein